MGNKTYNMIESQSQHKMMVNLDSGLRVTEPTTNSFWGSMINTTLGLEEWDAKSEADGSDERGNNNHRWRQMGRGDEKGSLTGPS